MLFGCLFAGSTERERSFYTEYCAIRFYENVYHRLAGCIKQIRAMTAQLAAELAMLRTRLRDLEVHFGRPLVDRQPGGAAGMPAARRPALPALVSSTAEAMAPAFEDRLRSSRKVSRPVCSRATTKPGSGCSKPSGTRQRLPDGSRSNARLLR